MPIFTNKTFYEKITFTVESDFGKTVTEPADQIFDPNIKSKVTYEKIKNLS